MVAHDYEHQIHRSAAPAGSLFETFADKVQRRAEDVIAGRDCPWPPSAHQRQLLTLLRPHQGIRRAVHRQALANRMGIDDRLVRAGIQSLRQDFGVLIGSATDADASGYFLCATERECSDTLASLRKHAVTTLRVELGMRGGEDHINDLLHQLRLEMSKEEADRG